MMKKFSFIFMLLASALAYPAAALARFHFTPVYNYNTDQQVKQLKTTKTDTGKLNILFSLAFGNNNFAEGPADIDTGYLNQVISINERAKLFDDKPFHTLLLALREDKKSNYGAEIILLKTAIDQFDEQNIEVAWLLIETRWMFNIVNRQDEKYQFYTKKLSYYLQKGQYRNAAACYHCLAGCYLFIGDNNNTINNYLKADELFKDFSNLWYVHEFSVVGSTYANWGNYAKGFFYLKKAIKLDAQFGFLGDKYIALLSFATMEYTLKHYQSSLNYIYILNHDGRVDNPDDVSLVILIVLNDIGLNRIDDASQLIKKLKAVSEGPSIVRIMRAGGNYNIEFAFYKYYAAVKNIPQAEKYLEKAYQGAKSDANVIEEITYLKELRQFYGDRKNIIKAWQYGDLYNQVNDSLRNRTSSFNVASYENVQKENEQNKKLILLRQQRAVQEATIGQRNMIIWISLIGLVAVLGSLIFIYRQLQINKRNLNNLKTTQTQLIQSEKMASLGELTAGIAHEIQNPLNFVNNFSEVNKEMLEELKAESIKPKADRDGQLEAGLINDLIENEQKINHHGKRADSIVKGMLEHSRTRSGQKELTDLNAMADEFMRLSYHGLRAKDKLFNSELVTHFDPNLPKINVVQQDVGRVFLNLFNNAFYAVNQKQKTAGADYKPEVTVSTSTETGQVIIKVKDNGIGIPDAVKDKIMQPFFTTKPTGEGTGLGLSLTYDMVVKGHGGSIDVDTKEGEGSAFIVSLPVKTNN